MRLDGGEGNFQLQLAAEDGHHRRHLRDLQLCRLVAVIHRLPAAVEHCAVSTAEGDADCRRIALPCVRLEVCKAVARLVDFAAFVDVQMVFIEGLAVTSCCPVQIDVFDAAFGIFRQRSYFFVFDPLGIRH